MCQGDLPEKEAGFLQRGCLVNKVTGNKFNHGPYRVISIELEPTHYKTDLWNVVSDCEHIDLAVNYTQLKNWAPDGGHNYLRFPRQHYSSVVLTGRGLFGALKSAIYVVKNIIVNKPDAVIICGYSHIQTVFALFTAIVLGKFFLLYVDEFNTKQPPGKFSVLKWTVRETLRKFTFAYAKAILVCGQKGVESTIEAGCAPNKIYDFPYVVDLERIQNDMPEAIPEQCIADTNGLLPILFFSGRMIERKGLPSLLHALSSIDADVSWVLWIEGAGPEIDSYVALAHRYGIASRCRFLGFCQYDLHSWLVRNSDIVIVPSLEDNWGIVVDEGLQLGKIVVSSDATGSGCDRITDGANGFIFRGGDSVSLASLLKRLIKDRPVAVEVAARSSPKNIKPTDNLKTLLGILNSISE